MTDERKAALALFVGSVGGAVTMAIHPTVAKGQQQLEHLMALSGVAHSLALVSVLLLFLGTCGLTRVLWAEDRLALAAAVTFGFASVAVMIAAAVSGWVVPDAMRLMARDEAGAAAQWRIAIAVVFQLNQAMSRIYSVGGAVAILMWSVVCLRLGRMSRGVAVFGCVSAPLVIVLIAVGHLRLDVHGMAAVMVTQVIWFVGMGVGLWRRGAGV